MDRWRRAVARLAASTPSKNGSNRRTFVVLCRRVINLRTGPERGADKPNDLPFGMETAGRVQGGLSQRYLQVAIIPQTKWISRFVNLLEFEEARK